MYVCVFIYLEMYKTYLIELNSKVTIAMDPLLQFRGIIKDTHCPGAPVVRWA